MCANSANDEAQDIIRLKQSAFAEGQHARRKRRSALRTVPAQMALFTQTSCSAPSFVECAHSASSIGHSGALWRRRPTGTSYSVNVWANPCPCLDLVFVRYAKKTALLQGSVHPSVKEKQTSFVRPVLTWAILFHHVYISTSPSDRFAETQCPTARNVRRHIKVVYSVMGLYCGNTGFKSHRILHAFDVYSLQRQQFSRSGNDGFLHKGALTAFALK